MDDNHQIVLDRSIIVGALVAIAVFLVLASIAGQLTKFILGHDTVYGLIRLFNLDEENNIPTYFSASLLLLASVLLWIISLLKRTSRAPYALHWKVIAVLFLCLAVDEASSIHELLMRPMDEILGRQTSGFFYFGWVVPGMVLVFLVTIFFFKFLFHLPVHTRLFFALAAFLYIGGAIGIELIAGRYAEQHGFNNIVFNMISTLEEGFEMAGVIVFVDALMVYIQSSYGEIRVRFQHFRSR
jgi:hypothetical protein